MKERANTGAATSDTRLQRRAIFREDQTDLKTCFAPAERARREQLLASLELISRDGVVSAILDVAGVFIMVVNRERQILLANQELLASLGVSTSGELVGLRPGESLDCIYAWENPGGCGTSSHCSSCGAAVALMGQERSGEAVEGECLMTVRRGESTEAMELRVRAAPLIVGEERLTILSLRDISAEKQRDQLESVFFHDVLNTVSGILGYSRLLQRKPATPDAGTVERIAGLAERLAREITDQRSRVQAEKGSLVLNPAPVQVAGVLQAARETVLGHDAATELRVELTCESGIGELITDETLLLRVLTNMLKNAVEATPPPGTVRLSAVSADGGYRFDVWNAGEIPQRVAQQIFYRSFSTKASSGRGLGTYSMRLFGERYLGGRVNFTTGPEGTVFSLWLPRSNAGGGG